MLLLRLLQGMRDALPYLLMVSLIGEGLVALLAMFAMPPVSLLMVFVAMGTLAVYVALRWILDRLAAGLAGLLGRSRGMHGGKAAP